MTEEEHKTHDPENAPVAECPFCVVARRAHPVPLCHGDGKGSAVVPPPEDPE